MNFVSSWLGCSALPLPPFPSVLLLLLLSRVRLPPSDEYPPTACQSIIRFAVSWGRFLELFYNGPFRLAERLHRLLLPRVYDSPTDDESSIVRSVITFPMIYIYIYYSLERLRTAIAEITPIHRVISIFSLSLSLSAQSLLYCTNIDNFAPVECCTMAVQLPPWNEIIA